eukprot:COSAG01_NODE_1045_length_11952_cov_98.448241_5_plen_68_part_00
MWGEGTWTDCRAGRAGGMTKLPFAQRSTAIAACQGLPELPGSRMQGCMRSACGTGRRVNLVDGDAIS